MLCWWCAHPPPEGKEFIHMPYKYKNNVFETMGQFCSWECMKSFAVKEYNQGVSGRICTLISLMRSKTGIPSSNTIKSAPKRFCLKEFGGDITIEEFRSKNSNIVYNNLPIYKNFIVPTTYTKSEQKYTEPININNTDEKLLMINSSSGINEPLKLKRNKPIKKHTTTNLETSLGIKKKSSFLSVGGL